MSKDLSGKIESTDWKAEVSRFLQGRNIATVTYKHIKQHLKEKFGKEFVQAEKQSIKDYAKTCVTDLSEEKLEKAEVFTLNNALAPRCVAKLQANSMTKAEFLEKAPNITIEVAGNRAVGPPRVFTSGNHGWWTGGKILVELGDKLVWAQLGVNITLLGSKTWE